MHDPDGGAFHRVLTSGVAMRSLAVLGWLTAMTLSVAAAAEINPVRTHPHTAPATSVTQIIVKLRAADPGETAHTAQQRIAGLAARTAVGLRTQRPITTLLHVLRFEPAGGESTGATLERLRHDPQVEYAELDQRRYVHALPPSDPDFPQQWYLQSAAATPSAVNALSAWATTEGLASLVIADIDTGVRADHPDLAGRLLPGYCFISDAFVANGGACPGAGAIDPGDWVTLHDIGSSPNGECSKVPAPPNGVLIPSSWHGTRVAGILGATTDDHIGIAGLTWNTQLLPVRALGKCGGLDSDIISAMLWAAGIPVNGAPLNTNPAKIINMSLGGSGSCPSSYDDAIGQIAARGILVVVSAGNEGGPVDAPANCSGVAGVTGLRHAGTKVGYSSLGPQISLAAPAGNCGNGFNATLGSACIYEMETTTNLGYQQPDANDYTGEYYCDPTTGTDATCTLSSSSQYRIYNIGTSFSAPVVSGIAALMSAVNGKLNSCQLIDRLKEGATPFPQSSLDAVGAQPPMCHVPANGSDVQNAECICTRDGRTCGAGMANAPAAIAAALRPIAAVAVPEAVTAGTAALDGSGSTGANNHTVVSYQWSNGSGGLALTISDVNGPKASVTPPACGIGTVQLTVTDDVGRTDTADVIVTPTSVTTRAPAQAGQASCPLTAVQVQVAVCPASASVHAGSGSQSFTATLANTTNAAVSWHVNGVAGGNSTVGTISSTGVYTAPASAPTPAMVTITAVSDAESSATGSAQVDVTGSGSSSKSGGGATDLLTLLLGATVLARPRSRRR
jgi:serine protease